MPSLLTRLANLIPGFRSAPTAGSIISPSSTPTARDPAQILQATKDQLDKSRNRPRPSTDERVPANYHAGVAGKVWFLPFLDSATQDSPEIREAMRLMRRDPYVKAAWEPQMLTVASEDWQIQPSEAGNQFAEEQATFVERVFKEYVEEGMLGMVRAIAGPWSSDGFSIAEKVMEVAQRGRCQKQIVLKALKAKDPNALRVEGDRFNNVSGVLSLRRHGEEFPIEDFVYTRYMPVFDEPLGQAAYRPSYGSYWMRDTVRKLRAIHCEKKMAGMLVGTYENFDDKTPLEAALTRAKSATWMTIPAGTRVEALQLSTASEPDYRSFDESLRDEIVTGIAFATLQIIMGTVPDARGDSQVQKTIYDLGPWLIMTMVMIAINRQLIPDLVDYNYPFPAAGGYPELTFGAANNHDLLELIQVVEGAQQLGFIPSKKHYAAALSIQQADPNDPDDALMPGGMGGLGPMGMGTTSDPGAGGQLPLGQFSDKQPFHSFHAGAVKWTQIEGGKWKSERGRVISNAVYQRMLAHQSKVQKSNPASASQSPQTPIVDAAIGNAAKVVAKAVRRLPSVSGQVGAKAVAQGASLAAGLGGKLKQLKWLEQSTGLGSEIEKSARRTMARAQAVAAAYGQGMWSGKKKAAREMLRVMGVHWKESRRKFGVLGALALEGACLAFSSSLKALAVGASVVSHVPGLGFMTKPAKVLIESILKPTFRKAASYPLNKAFGYRSAGRKLRVGKDKKGNSVTTRRFAEPVSGESMDLLRRLGGDSSGMLATLREMIEDIAAATNQPMPDINDFMLAGVLNQMMRYIRQRVVHEHSDKTDTFSWQAAQTRTNTVKAVGTGDDQGKTLYGKDAEAALQPQKKSTEPQVTQVKSLADHGREQLASHANELAALPDRPPTSAINAAWKAVLGSTDAISNSIGHSLSGALGSPSGHGVAARLQNLAIWLAKQPVHVLQFAVKKLADFAKWTWHTDTAGTARGLLGAGAKYIGTLAGAVAVAASPALAVGVGLMPVSAGFMIAPAAAVGTYMVMRHGMHSASATAAKALKIEGRNSKLEPAEFAERCGKGCPHHFADSVRSDVAVAGKDGQRAAQLLSRAQEFGASLFREATKSAVTRLLGSPNPMHAHVLFNDDELQKIQEGLGKIITSADLLGRARIRRKAELAEARATEPIKMAESDDDPFHVFAADDPLPVVHPKAAQEYFQRLVPSLSPIVERYGPKLDRHTFTLAVASDQVLLERVKQAIADELAGGESATPLVQRILDAAGVGPKNPQYADMVVRTNMMDAFNQGAMDELATPEMQVAFPAWQYLGILDDRTGDDHRPKIDKYYPSTTSFAEVRGPRVWNCRCSFQPISKYLMSGVRVENEW